MFCFLWLFTLVLPSPATRPTFTNPIIKQEAGDPWVAQKDGFYYFTATLDPDHGLWIWKSPTLSGLDAGKKVKVWTAPKTGMMSRMIWSPELHWLEGRWYLYFTAGGANDSDHRLYVLESNTDDAQGAYTLKGQVDHLESDEIDGSVLKMPDGKLYWMFTNGRLHLAPMSNPWTADGTKAIVLSTATEPWERGWIEGPEPLVHNGKVFVIYSGASTFSPDYSLGMLSFTGGDPLDAKNWVKTKQPVFKPYQGPDGAVFTVGHNGFATSPDGKEDWIIYHGKDFAAENSTAGRTIRTQPFTWNADGTPNFGHPIPAGVPIARPSGE